MTVVQLECFMEVVRQRNFSKAADNLYLSQATLTRYIQALEAELHVGLFVRSHNATRLTAIGQVLYPTLERMYNDFRSADEEIHEIIALHEGLLRIGVSASLHLQDAQIDAIRRLQETYPAAKIRLYHMNLNKMNTALMSGVADAVFSLDEFVLSSDLVRRIPLCEDQMCLAVPASHPNAGLPRIKRSEIKSLFPDLDFTLLDVSSFEAELQDGLKEFVDIYDTLTLTKSSDFSSDIDNIILTVEAGLAVTCINENSILRENRRIRLIPLVEETEDGIIPVKSSVGIYSLKKNNNPILKSFLQLLQE